MSITKINQAFNIAKAGIILRKADEPMCAMPVKGGSGKTGWIPATNFDEGKKRLRKLYKIDISVISFPPPFTITEDLKQINMIGKQMAGMSKFSKVSKKLLSKGYKNVLYLSEDVKSIVTSTSKGAHGVYSKKRGWIRLATKEKSWNPSERIFDLKDKMFTFSRGNVPTTFRHEYGHHYYARGMNKAKQVEWDNMYNKLTDFGKNSQHVTDTITKYAATNSHEMYAESFSIYTSPHYGKQGDFLPPEIDEFFKKLLGKKAG